MKRGNTEFEKCACKGGEKKWRSSSAKENKSGAQGLEYKVFHCALSFLISGRGGDEGNEGDYI